MTLFTLGLSVLLALSGAHRPSDGSLNDAPAGAPPSDTLVTLSRGAGLPAWNLAPTSASRFQIWTNTGYGVISDFYDGERNAYALGSDVALPTDLATLAAAMGASVPDGTEGTVQGHSGRVVGAMHVANFHLGGSYDVVVKPRYRLALGADLGLSQHDFQAEQLDLNFASATVTMPAYGYENEPWADFAADMAAAGMPLTVPPSLPNDTRVNSGFEAQSLTLFGEFKQDLFSVRLGYHADLGPEADAARNRGASTDGQDALLGGASVRYPLGSVLLFGGVDAFFTRKAEAYGLSYDQGNVYGVMSGLGYRFGPGEFGAAVTLRYREEGTITAAIGDQAFALTRPSAYHVGIAPYASFSPVGAAYSVYVKGGVQDEYRDYTLSVTGENDLAPHVGATFGFVYGF